MRAQLDVNLVGDEKLGELSEKELYVHHKVLSREMRENLASWMKSHKNFNPNAFMKSMNKTRDISIAYDSEIGKAYGLIYEAIGHLNKHEDVKGSELLEAALSLDSVNEEALKIKMDVLLSHERFEDAIVCADKLIGLEGLKGECYAEAYFTKVGYIVGEAFSRRSKAIAREALLCIEEGLSHDDENWDLIMEKAVLLYQLGYNSYTDWIDKAKRLDKKRAERFVKDVWFTGRILR